MIPRYLFPLAILLFVPGLSQADTSPIFSVPRLDGIAIDGDPADWGDGGFRIDLLSPNRPQRAALSDFDGRARLAWDAQGLLFFAQVTDDQIQEANHEGSLWTGDGLELFLAVRRGARDCVQYIVAPGISEDYPDMRWRFYDYRKTPALKDLPSDPRFGRRRTDSGYTLEAHLPWSALDIAPALGLEIGFQFYINDRDEDSTERLLFFPGDDAHANPLVYHRLQLSAAASEPYCFMSQLRLDRDPKAPLSLSLEARHDTPIAEFTLRQKSSTLSRAPARSEGNISRASFSIAAGQADALNDSIEIYGDGQLLGALQIDPAYLQARPLLAEVAQVRQRLERDRLPADQRRNAAVVLAYADLLDQLLFDYDRDLGEVRKRARGVPDNVAALSAALADYRTGADTYADRRGGFIAGYISQVDRSGQLYSLYVPPHYGPEKTWPLHVHMHGYGGTFGAPIDPEPVPDYLMAFVDGRGQTGYTGLGERDVLEVIADVRSHYRVDPDRIYLRGGSMGGRGTWTLASRHPDLFAGVLPDYGWADDLFLENLANLPLWNFHDDADWVVPIDHSRAALSRLRDWGYPVIHSEASGGGHSTQLFQGQAERDAWLAQQVRNPHPQSVRLAAPTPYRSRAYWLEIRRFADPNRIATVHARFQSPNQLFLQADNVRFLRVDLVSALFDRDQPLTVGAGGEPQMLDAPLPEALYVHFQDDGSLELSGEDPLPALGQRPYIAGGLNYIWSGGEPFAIVRPTGAEPALRDSIDAFCAFLQRETGSWYWEQMPLGRIPILDDIAVTDADMERYNLILIGPASANRLLARLASRLPVQEKQGRLHFAGQQYDLTRRGYTLFYYNPAAPNRYIGVLSSTSPSFYRPTGDSEFIGAINSEAPAGFTLVQHNPERQTVCQILWNEQWQPDLRPGDEYSIPAALARESAWEEARIGAIRRATSADYYLGPGTANQEAQERLVWDPRHTRWHDLRAYLSAPLYAYRTELTGAELVELNDFLAKEWSDVAFYPEVDPARIVADARYTISMPSWMGWELGSRRQRNLPNVEWLRLTDLWMQFRRQLPAASRKL